MTATVRSLLMLGLISILSMGVAQIVGAETVGTVQAGGTGELRGTEFPFPVGWVPASDAGESFVAEEARETGALPGSVVPVEELRGTEFPFPVGFVPEGAE